MTNNMLLLRNGGKILVNRFGKTTPDYSIISRFKLAIDMADITVTDTDIQTLIPISGTETVDDCSATTGWTISGTNSISVNSTTYKSDGGTAGALNIIKSDTSAATLNISKTTTSLNGTSKDFLIWIYIKDATALAKLKSSGTCFTIRFGSDSSNYYYKDYTVSSLAVGWNFLKIIITSGFTGTTGSPSITGLDYTYLFFETNNTTDTLAAGDLIFDAIRLASVDDYYKNIDSLTIDEADNSITVVSKLTISEANGFLLNGHATENADTSALLATKTKYTGTSKGNTDLIKFTTKLQFRNVGE